MPLACPEPTGTNTLEIQWLVIGHPMLCMRKQRRAAQPHLSDLSSQERATLSPTRRRERPARAFHRLRHGRLPWRASAMTQATDCSYKSRGRSRDRSPDPRLRPCRRVHCRPRQCLHTTLIAHLLHLFDRATVPLCRVATPHHGRARNWSFLTLPGLRFFFLPLGAFALGSIADAPY